MESTIEIICPKCSQHIDKKHTNFCPSCGIEVSYEGPFQPSDINPELKQKYMPALTNNTAPKTSLAGFWIRLGAFWMDSLIIFLIAMFIGSLVYSTALGQRLFPNAEKVNLFLVLLFIFYHGLSLGAFNTTPGKRFFGLMVISEEISKRFGYADAFLRTLSYFISGFFFLIGFLWIGVDRNKQGLHDKIAKTFVVRKPNVHLLKKVTALVFITLFILVMIALQFNITWVYQSVFNPDQNLSLSNRLEVIILLATQKEVKNGVYKEVTTRTGPYAIKIPSSAHDGDIFKVNRSEDQGGTFYIKIVIVELI